MGSQIEAAANSQQPAWLNIAEDLISTVTQVVAGVTQQAAGGGDGAAAVAGTPQPAQIAARVSTEPPAKDPYHAHVTRVVRAVKVGNETAAAIGVIQWYVASTKGGADARLNGFAQNPAAVAKKIVTQIGGDDMDAAFASSVAARVVAEIERMNELATAQAAAEAAGGGKTAAKPAKVEEPTAVEEESIAEAEETAE